VALLSDFPAQLRRRKRLYLGDGFRAVDVVAIRGHGDHLIVQLADVTSPAGAVALFGELLYVRRDEAATLPRGSYFEHEVVGLRVETAGGRDLGTVTEILRTGANDVYVVRGDLGEVLIPAVRHVVRRVEIANRRIIVEIIPGLLPGDAEEP
jgi:16S rRNA processing protein RimM